MKVGGSEKKLEEKPWDKMNFILGYFTVNLWGLVG